MDKNKRYMIVVIIRGVLVAVALFLFILQFSKPEYRVFFGISMVIFYLFSIFSKSIRRDTITYNKMTEGYKEILEGVFPEERGKYETFVKAISLYNRNQADKAIEILKKLELECSIPREYESIYTLWSLCCSEKGLIDGAIAYAEKALKINPTNAILLSNIGVFYASKGRTDDAIEIFKRAAEHNPKEHVAFHNAATFLLKAGEVEESIEYGLKALELSPKNEETMATLALAYKMQGDEERFAKYYQMSKEHGYKTTDLDVMLGRM